VAVPAGGEEHGLVLVKPPPPPPTTGILALGVSPPHGRSELRWTAGGTGRGFPAGGFSRIPGWRFGSGYQSRRETVAVPAGGEKRWS
jgi:hypothetical protein